MSGSLRLRAVNLTLRFLIEVAALAGLAFWGFTAGHSTTGRWVLAVATPVAAAWLWGMYAAPASSHRLTGAARLAVEWLVFGGAAVATAVAGQPWIAVAFVVVAGANAFVLARTTPVRPAAHSAGGCQCCSGATATEPVSAMTSSGGPAASSSQPPIAPSAATGSVATPRG
jgi:hypothetical protein